MFEGKLLKKIKEITKNCIDEINSRNPIDLDEDRLFLLNLAMEDLEKYNSIYDVGSASYLETEIYNIEPKNKEEYMQFVDLIQTLSGFTKEQLIKEEGRTFESLYKIGELVKIELDENTLVDGYIRAVIFTNSKVRYSVRLKNMESTLHNIDSVLIKNHDKYEEIDFGEDNYS